MRAVECEDALKRKDPQKSISFQISGSSDSCSQEKALLFLISMWNWTHRIIYPLGINEKLMPSCLLASSLPFSVSNSTEVDALPCVLPAIPQQKDSSDWIGMVAMVAEGHKLLSGGSWHNSMHYLHPGANQSLYLISSLTNSHLPQSLTIKDAILLNSLRQGMRITESWKLILVRPLSAAYRHLQALATHIAGVQKETANKSFLYSFHGSPWQSPYPLASQRLGLLTSAYRICSTIPAQVPGCFLPQSSHPVSISRTWSLVLPCCNPGLDTSKLSPDSLDRLSPF